MRAEFELKSGGWALQSQVAGCDYEWAESRWTRSSGPWHGCSGRSQITAMADDDLIRLECLQRVTTEA